MGVPYMGVGWPAMKSSSSSLRKHPKGPDQSVTAITWKHSWGGGFWMDFVDDVWQRWGSLWDTGTLEVKNHIFFSFAGGLTSFHHVYLFRKGFIIIREEAAFFKMVVDFQHRF